MHLRTTLTLAAATALTCGGLATESAHAAGMIRDPDVQTAGHSALSIGAQIFSYSSNAAAANYYGAANPFVSGTNPFTTHTGGDAALYTDVAANPTTSSGYASNFNGTQTSTSQVSAYKWFLGVNLGFGGTRDVIGNVPGTLASQTYAGDTATIQYTGVGTGSYRFDVRFDQVLTDGPTGGRANVVAVATLTRRDGTAGTVNVSVGELVDLDAGPNGGTGDAASTSATTFAGPGGGTERRLRLTDGANFGEAVAVNPTSYAFAARPTLGGTLDGAGTSLGNSLAGGTGDYAAGFLWHNQAFAVGESRQYVTAFAVNQSAVAPVPEPATLAAVAGIAGLLAARRRRAC